MQAVFNAVVAAIEGAWFSWSPWARAARAERSLVELRDEIRSNAGRTIMTGDHTGTVRAGQDRWFFDASISDATVVGTLYLGSWSRVCRSTIYGGVETGQATGLVLDRSVPIPTSTFDGLL